jgi:ABC-type multidrug transport system permease subunit
MAARLPPAPTTDVFRKAIEDAARDAGATAHKGAASDVESGGASGASGGAHQQPLRYGSVVFRPVGEIVKDSGGLFVASFFKQFTVLLQRSFLATLRNPLSTYVRVIQTIVLGLIAGFIFYDVGNGQKAIQNLQGLVFFTIINQSLSSIFATLQTFPLERPVLLREHEAGAYRIDAFYFARTLSDVPFQIIFPTAFVAIIWALAGVSDDADRFGLFLAVLLLASNGGFSLGFLLSAVAPSVEVALGLAPLVLLPFMLTAGLFVNVDSLGPGIEWVAHISFMKYGFAGACTAIFKGRKFECDVPPFQPCFSEGDQVLRALSVDADDDDFTMNLVALSIIIVAFRLIGLFALQLSARRRQNA